MKVKQFRFNYFCWLDWGVSLSPSFLSRPSTFNNHHKTPSTNTIKENEQRKAVGESFNSFRHETEEQEKLIKNSGVIQLQLVCFNIFRLITCLLLLQLLQSDLLLDMMLLLFVNVLPLQLHFCCCMFARFWISLFWAELSMNSILLSSRIDEAGVSGVVSSLSLLSSRPFSSKTNPSRYFVFNSCLRFINWPFSLNTNPIRWW